jgi:hypothetical protein
VAIIPASIGVDLRESLEGEGLGSSVTVVAEVRVFGHTLGGDEIESAIFNFPIDVCYGCLVAFPLEAVENGSCLNATEAAPDFDGCRAGQDDPIDCRACVVSQPDVCDL